MNKVISLADKKEELKNKSENLMNDIEKELQEFDEKYGEGFSPSSYEEASAEVDALFSLGKKADELHKISSTLNGKRVNKEDTISSVFEDCFN